MRDVFLFYLCSMLGNGKKKSKKKKKRSFYKQSESKRERPTDRGGALPQTQSETPASFLTGGK